MLPLKFNERFQFIRCFLKNPKKVGAILPSSTQLSEKITRKIPSNNVEISNRYLEIGAGTGSFTEHIINRLKEEDHLDIVEFDPNLCDILRKKFGSFPNIFIHQISILDFQSEFLYDGVVSGLPFNAFQADKVEKIFKKLTTLTKNKGYVSYFEYIGLAKLKGIFLFGSPLDDFKKVLSLKKRFKEEYATETDYIWLNLTPARVQHCRIGN